MDHDHPLMRPGLLSDQELVEARGLFDRLCTELAISSTAARDMAAGLMITMVSSGQRDAGHIRTAIERFAHELNGKPGEARSGA